MTLLEIEQNIYRRTDKNVTSPDATTKARIDTFINDRYRELMRLSGVIEIRDESFTFTTVSGQARYALPASTTSIVSVVDSTHRLPLHQRTLAWIRQRDPSVPAQVQGTPFVYAVLNAGGVSRQPTVTTPNALEMLSTSGLDNGMIEIEYETSDGGFSVAQQSLLGAPGVPVTLTIQASRVFRAVYLGTQAPSGTITIRQVVGAAVILTIPSGQNASLGSQGWRSSGQWVLHLWPTPGGPFTYTVDGSRPRATLVDPNDTPAFPEEFHTMLVWGACEEELLKMDDTRRNDYEQKWMRDLKAFRAYLHQSRGQRWIPGQRGRVGWTPLGSQFPPWQ